MSSETGPTASQGEKGHSIQTVSQRMGDMTLPISVVGTHSRASSPSALVLNTLDMLGQQ